MEGCHLGFYLQRRTCHETDLVRQKLSLAPPANTIAARTISTLPTTFGGVHHTSERAASRTTRVSPPSLSKRKALCQEKGLVRSGRLCLPYRLPGQALLCSRLMQQRWYEYFDREDEEMSSCMTSVTTSDHTCRPALASAFRIRYSK